MRMWRYGGLMVFLVLLCGQAPVEADSEVMLQRVRLSVAKYDLADGGIMQVLGEMAEALRQSDNSESVQREMQFLHGAVSADMLFLSAYRNDDGLRAQLIENWSSDAARIKADIVTSLQTCQGIYREPAQRIIRRLAIIADDGSLNWESLANASGSWRDIALLRVAAKAVTDGETNAVLRRFGKDPCADIKGGCNPLFMTYDGESRATMAGLLGLGQAHTRLSLAEQQGDPLSAALTEEIEADYASVATVSLRLVPMVRSGARAETKEARPNRVPVDLLVHLSAEYLEFGYVPRVRLNDKGELESVVDREPALPRMARVDYPKSFRPFMRPISEFVDALQDRGEIAQDVSVGVSAEPGLESHILGRVFLSLRRVGFDQAAVIGRGQEGLAFGIPLRVLAGEEADQMQPKPDIEVRVRLGGYSLKLPNGLVNDIPRVRYDDKGYRFDTETLYRQVRNRKIRSAAVSFMGTVAVENLMAAMWRVAPEQSALNLVMP